MSETSFQFCFHVQILESAFVNMYWGLNFSHYGFPATAVLASARENELPDFRVRQAANYMNGTVAITTPPPHVLNKVEFPAHTPKGRAHFAYVGLDDLVQQKLKLVDCNKEKDATSDDYWPNPAVRDSAES